MAGMSLFFILKMEFQPIEQYGILLPKDTMEVVDMSWIQRLEVFISSNSHLISLFWLLGSFSSFVKYYIGFYQIKRIKQFSSLCNNTHVLDAVNRIKKQLNVQDKIHVRTSALINSPLTSGWLRPIIFLPIGMISGFTTDEIESILCHELVHIKRQDYLINIMLACLETLFFFNPFVLVLIRDIRSDMEFACDDRVLKHNDKSIYVHALLKLQELRITHSLGLAARSNNSEFIKRINKMMNQTNNSNEKNKLIPGLIVCLFIAVSIMGSAFISKSEPVEEVIQTRTNNIHQDTVRVATKDELKRAVKRVGKENFAKTVFVLNGKVVPIISGENLEKGETMMKHIHKELVRDGILSEENTRVRLMFQYSDLLNGKEVLGDKYPKYKKIFNDYFPVYDSYATTRVFKYKD